ncbi:porin [Terrarubrum flagellatum]|uniref:porin n=1 Tax=Terrirubrum flagellatum TaxID=2895980 RepID=UPI003145138C
MKLVKSLLLGSAAGIAAVASASAADLPSRKAAPAEYVKVCSAYGAGFFYIPGTDVCLKVGGFARYQMQYSQPFAAHASPFGTRAQGRLELDARNPTAYGTLRAFVRVDVAVRTGNERSGSAFRQGYAIDVVGNGNTTGGANYAAANDSGWAGRSQTQVILDKAFVQWGGFVAGRTTSLFDFNKSPEIIGTIPMSSLGTTNVLGYIATFGSGFYASVSAEDAIWRRQALSNAGVGVNGAVGGAGNDLAGGSAVSYYGGSRMPDIVAALGVEQSWGAAQVSAAVHQIPVVGIGGANVNSKYGWAVQGGVMINLPMLAPGDYLWVNAAYADGAMSYVHSNWFSATLNNQGLGNSFAYYGSDAYINPLTNGVAKSKTWGVVAALQHFWAPTLRSGFFGGYSQFNNPGNIADWNYWAAGANLMWSPVRALDIGIEGAYQRIEGKGSTALYVPGVVAQTGVTTNGQPSKQKDGAWTVRFRVQRTF